MRSSDYWVMMETTETRRQTIISLFVFCLFCGVIFAAFGQRLFTHSADVGWHYSLAYFFSQSERLPAATDQYLAVMLGYPPGFHIAGAISGAVLGSPLFGLHYVALLSLFVIYYIIASIVLSRPQSLLAGALFLALLVSLQATFGGVIGDEIIGNAFYPQLGGTALFFASMAYLSKLGSSPLRYFIVAVVSTFLTAWVYTLSAVWLAIGAGVLFVLLQPFRTLPIRWAVAIFAALSIVVLSHPTFAPMVGNSNHGGAFVPTYYQQTLAIAAGLVILAVVLLVRTSRSNRSPGDALVVAIALASAAGITVQMALLQLAGMGSGYAVTKHVFLASSALIVALCVLAADLVSTVVHQDVRAPFPRSLQALMIALLSVGILLLGQPSSPISPFVLYLSDARALEHASSPEDLASNILPLNKDFEIAENFAVLAAHFGGGWTATAYELFEVLGDRTRPMGEPIGSKYSLISKAHWEQLVSGGTPERCLVHTSAVLAVSTLILSQCYPDTNGNADAAFCIDTWAPGEGTPLDDGLVKPASGKDGEIRWTARRRTILELPLICRNTRDYTIRVLVAFAVTERTLNSFSIAVNGHHIPLRRTPGRNGQLFEGAVPDGVMNEHGEMAEIAVNVSDLDQLQTVNKEVGVALRRIDILGKK